MKHTTFLGQFAAMAKLFKRKNDIPTVANPAEVCKEFETPQNENVLSRILDGQTTEKEDKTDGVSSEPTPASGLNVRLNIECTQFEDVEVLVTNPHKTIRKQIDSIVKVFDLPRTDNCGNAIQYLLGILRDDNEEPDIFDFEDEDGKEHSISGYNIQPGDHLCLFAIPAYACPVPKEMRNKWTLIAYACPVPAEMERKWEQYSLHNK